jgi:hypothetical protein
MKGQLAILLFFSLGQSMAWAEAPTGLDHLKGLYAQWMESRAELMRAGLGERSDIREQMNNIEKRISEQSILLNLAPPQTKNIHHPDFSEPEPVAWLPRERETQALSLERRKLPAPWVPQWGTSFYSRRAGSPKYEISPTPLEGFQLPEESALSTRHAPAPVLPEEKVLEPHAQLSLIESGLLSSTTINLYVPSPYSHQAWWLWEKRDHNPWVKVRSGWADQNVLMDHLPEGLYAYRFTLENHRPSEEPEHFRYRLDTSAPRIESFQERRGHNGSSTLTWASKDQQGSPIIVSIVVYNQNDGVLLSLDNQLSQGTYLLLREHRRLATRAKLTARDQAGNKSEQWLKLE